MNKQAIKKGIFGLTLALVALAPNAKAQLGDLNKILEGGVTDANYLLKEFMNPFATGFGAGLNTGWTQSAQPHGFLPIPGFHIRVGVGVMQVPNADRSFTVDPTKLTSLRVLNNVMETPTISGKRGGSTSSFAFKDDPLNREAFSMPNGTGLPYVPAPMLQVGIGFLKKSQIMLRYVPEQDLGKFGSLSLFGVGLQHEILQYIPLASRIPLLNISFIGGFTNFNMSKDLEGGSSNTLDWTTKAWNANVVAGVTTPFIKILSVYGGVGIENATTTMAMKGTYTVKNAAGGTSQVEDPINMEFDGGTNARLLAGIRVKLAIIAFNAEYTLSQYPSVNVGVGISFR